jgi:hypothetical protein
MLGRSSGTVYEYLFASLVEPVEYYVEAGGVHSKTFKLDVIDLPFIKKIKVTYHYPSWLGLPETTEDPGGDLRAVAGTIAELTIETDRPLKSGIAEFDNNTKLPLEGSGTTLTLKVPIERDGMYHFSAVEQGQSVRLSEDYFIEARADNPPTVHFIRPRSDARVSPIEEVGVQVQADDDFGLTSMELHYSVNGAAEKTVNLIDEKGVKSAAGHTTIYLEEFKLQPGDVIAMYATAKDARTTSRTDIQFIEAQPYEKNYTQAQAGGGAGGGGGDQDPNQISQRQKEIIAATWNEIRGNNGKDKVASGENSKFLADVQAKLKDQANSLAQRAKSRELAGANQEFQSFVKDMEEAANQMGIASGKLKAQGWKDALEPEQKALQHLLRAEATFRDIQVAFGNQGGGGGGGGAGRDLANLFDLELDTEKNQYETGQQQSSSEQRQKEIDEALQKLEQLARRQQELAQAQRNNKQQTFEQRWQQEMLRRDAEELKKQMEQLSRNGQQGQQSQSQNGQQSQSQSQSQSGQQQSQSQSQSQSGQSGQQSGQQQSQSRPQMGRQQSASDQRLRQALDRLSQATDDMRSAQQSAQQQAQQQGQQQNGQPQNGQVGQTEANARRAADRLQEAKDLLGGLRKQEAASQVSDLSNRADKLAAQQHDFQNRLRQAYANPTVDPNKMRQQAEQFANEKDKMTAELDQMEKDMQKAARDLAGSQPSASARVREALSQTQQDETKLRMKYSADYIRRGGGAMMVPREPTISNSLDLMAEDLRKAQGSLNQGTQQQTARNQMERSLSQVEQMRSQMERLAGQQPGQQKGGQQPGQQPGQQADGQQPGGQQPGGQQPGGQQGGGQRTVGARGGTTAGPYGSQMAGPNGGRYDYGRYDDQRFRPEGIYDSPNGRVDPNRTAQDISRQLAELRTQFKDNPDIARQIGELDRDIQKLTIGQIGGPELEERLRRTVLPNLQALEVQLRRQLEESGGGQVRSGASDKVPPGYSDAVAEYFRRLGKGKR